MILSNIDIRKVLKDQSFIIDPLPEEDQIDTSSIDLRISMLAASRAASTESEAIANRGLVVRMTQNTTRR